MPRRRQPFSRPDTPPNNIRLTNRDVEILEGIHAFEGMLSLKQIDRLYFTGKGSSHPRQRINKLFVNHYVNMPGPKEIHRIPYGEAVYWLNKRGAEVVAGLRGETLQTFWYRREPRWSLVPHNLRVNDIRIAVMEACKAHPELDLVTWRTEQEFRAYPDTVSYRDERGRRRKRRVIPDGYFAIWRLRAGKREGGQYAFLLEVDMATEDNPRIGRSKIQPGIAYLGSGAYQARFGLKYGRWLFITTGETRMDNMRAQARRFGAKGQFYFTTFDKVGASTILNEAIWHLSDKDAPIALIP